MRFFILLGLVIPAVSVFSDELSSLQKIRLEALRILVEKNELCDFAVASFPKGKLANFDHFQPTSVTCVGNITIGANTLKQQSGCGIFDLNLETGQMRSPAGGYFSNYFAIANGKTCANGGFAEVIKQSYHPAGYKTSDLLLLGNGTATRNAADLFTQIIVFARKGRWQALTNGKTQFETWFEKARPEALSRVEQESKRKPASQESRHSSE